MELQQVKIDQHHTAEQMFLDRAWGVKRKRCMRQTGDVNGQHYRTEKKKVSLHGLRGIRLVALLPYPEL